MEDWLGKYLPSRQCPRLWVETLWLLESREPAQPIRTIELRQGLNVVWAREPAEEGSSGFASFGHGVGKTSFCLLLRYCLGDDAPSINTMCDKTSAGFPKGGVAAKVHLDDETWMVFRPYGRGGQSLGGRGEELDALLSGALPGGFQEFMEQLEGAFVGRLTAKTLPGSNQLLEWRHLLAWCIRDQKTRFDAFFHWRDGDGLGFRRSRQDPPLFVRSVLGLLDRDLDGLMREVESLQSHLATLDGELPELERFPAYELRAAERQLRARLGAQDVVPLYRDTAEASIEDFVERRLRQAEAERVKVEEELEDAEVGLATELALFKDLSITLELREKDLGIEQSLLEGNESEFRRLSNELDELDKLVGKCRHGDVEYAVCEYVGKRRQTVSLPWVMRTQAAAADKAQCAIRVELMQRLVDEAKCAVVAQKEEVNRVRASLKRIQMRLATVLSDHDSLQSQWENLAHLYAQWEKGASSRELEEAKQRRVALVEKLGYKQSELLARKAQGSARSESLSSLIRAVTNRILGSEGFCAFRPESDTQPFELHAGGEAYQVLEILLGDITALLDSATSQSGLHPGLVVHDCPREADMSEKLYQEFLLSVMEAEEQLGREGHVPFQYIVTTTSPPPDVLCNEPFLRLELQPGAEDGLLFKRRLVPGLPGV